MFLHVLWLICFHASCMLDPSIDASLHDYITYVSLGFACSNLYVCVYMSHACMDFTCFWICIYMKQWFTCWICLDVIQLSMMFSVLIRIPTIVWLLFYESTCIDWLMIARCHLGIHMFVWVNMFTSLSLIAIYLICCVYIIFLWIFFFDKHFPLDIRMFSCHLHRWYCGFIIP